MKLFPAIVTLAPAGHRPVAAARVAGRGLNGSLGHGASSALRAGPVAGAAVVPGEPGRLGQHQLRRAGLHASSPVACGGSLWPRTLPTGFGAVWARMAARGLPQFRGAHRHPPGPPRGVPPCWRAWSGLGLGCGSAGADAPAAWLWGLAAAVSRHRLSNVGAGLAPGGRVAHQRCCRPAGRSCVPAGSAACRAAHPASLDLHGHDLFMAAPVAIATRWQGSTTR